MFSTLSNGSKGCSTVFTGFSEWFFNGFQGCSTLFKGCSNDVSMVSKVFRMVFQWFQGLFDGSSMVVVRRFFNGFQRFLGFQGFFLRCQLAEMKVSHPYYLGDLRPSVGKCVCWVTRCVDNLHVNSWIESRISTTLLVGFRRLPKWNSPKSTGKPVEMQ